MEATAEGTFEATPQGRPSFRDGTEAKAKAPKRGLRHRLTYLDKLRIIDHFRATGSMPETLHHFFPRLVGRALDTKRKNIYKWASIRADIEKKAKHPIHGSQTNSRPKGVGTTLSPAAEDQILEWIVHLRNNAVPVTEDMLQAKALEVAKAFGFSATQFKADWHWRKRFIKQYHLMPESPPSSPAPSDSDNDNETHQHQHVRTVQL
ncbi:hypothetical protein SDRG_02344 [Saprolegnia diclina VS20]|uniref:HTH CENPB-type domain-containing protein n=1 Tax=Saprolegnia diclina (strain VS20) TaxID=1156394 RepID=T0S5M4_SAPDV|nr:hypothetical protein SDRG_02344 [Saprolegnia diclina VS20]EQC40448.1 hypothetical protein SDRG_02344 [Saprolegnia diclina VS20]|eukprot:XP_008606147.1 hypothetical protein SDRG_02344 [Saprolegnia diclina VS20]